MREGCIQGGVCKPAAAAQAQKSWELYRRKGLQSFGTCFEDDGSFWPGYAPLERTYLELSELREVLFPYFVDEGDQTGLIPGPGPNTCQESVFNSQPSLHSFTASRSCAGIQNKPFPPWLSVLVLQGWIRASVTLPSLRRSSKTIKFLPSWLMLCDSPMMLFEPSC